MWAGTSGLVDDVPLEDVRRFERDFLDHLRRDKSGILDGIRETGELSDDTVTALKDAISEFRRGFETSAGEQLVGSEEPAEPVDESEIGQETIARRVPPAERR